MVKKPIKQETQEHLSERMQKASMKRSLWQRQLHGYFNIKKTNAKKKK